jgi:AsmA protein
MRVKPVEMRRVLVLIAIAVVVLILVALTAILMNVDKYRPRVQAELQKKLDRPVTLGHLGIRLLPFSIRVDGLTIGDAPEFGSNRPFATAKEVYVSAGLISLIRGNPQVKEVNLDRPQVELIRNRAGVWNFSTIGGAEKTAGSEKTSGNSSELTLDKLKITDGQVAVTDEVAKQPRSVYDHIDLQLSDFGPGKQFGIDLAVHFPGTGKELFAFNGKAGPLVPGNTAALPVSGHFSLQQITLSGVNRFSPGTIPKATDGVASGDGNISSSNELVACKGNLKIENTVIHGTKMDYPIEANYDLSDDRRQDKLQIRSGAVKLGPTSASVSGEIDAHTKPSNLNVRLTMNNSPIAELMRLAGAFSGASTAAYQAQGTITADIRATGPATAPQLNGSGTIAASTLKAQELVLNNLRAAAKLAGGVVQLSPVTADVFGGKENGTVSVDTRPAHPLSAVKIQLSGVDTNALLSAVSSMKNTLYGSLAADTNLTFALESGANLARTLNGTMNFNVTNGQLKNINILNELSKVGKFVKSAPAQSGSGTALKRLSGTMNIVNGVATTNNLIASLDAGSLSANGSVNLVDQSLNMHMTAVLASGMSQSVGGTSVGGFLNTALANKNGELVLPVVVTGTMAHPVFAPDVQAIAKMRLNNLLPTTGDPSKLTSGVPGAGGVLGGILGNTPGQATSPQGQKNNQQQQNPLGSVLQQLNKKKKPK